MLSSLLLAAVVTANAPVVSVTVFNDRARVVREASIEVHGPTSVSLAMLADSVDPNSIRLEALGAEVRKVDLVHVDADVFPEAAARKLLDQLDEADDRLALDLRERSVLRGQLADVQGLSPIAPSPDLRGPAPKLNSTGWTDVLAFLSGSAERLQARLRDTNARITLDERARQTAADAARALGVEHRRSGVNVIALLAGDGKAQVRLTYQVLGARWTPSWSLTYRAGRGADGASDETVLAQLDGLVSQETGESWTNSALQLSSAVPASVTALPELLSWRIGVKERFQPTSHPLTNPPPIAPLPNSIRTPSPREEDTAGRLRALLLERAAATDVEASAEGRASAKASQAQAYALGGGAGGETGNAPKRSLRNFAATPQAAAPSEAEEPADSVQSLGSSRREARPPPPVEQIGLLPPPSWRPPSYGANSPATLAGGFDLSFNSAQPITLESSAAAHRVPLVSQNWPVHTERVIYPALAQEAWLIAKLTIPLGHQLPGGDADLFVGDDPSGHATLSPMAPGDEISLPLGIDRALKPVRNVSQVQSEKGLFSKDDIDEYVVTIELANPYPRPIALRVIDQIPLRGDQRVDVEFLRAEPAAKPDPDTGKLEWALSLPAQQKAALTFSYRLRRPRGAHLHQ